MKQTTQIINTEHSTQRKGKKMKPGFQLKKGMKQTTQIINTEHSTQNTVSPRVSAEERYETDNTNFNNRHHQKPNTVNTRLLAEESYPTDNTNNKHRTQYTEHSEPHGVS